MILPRNPNKDPWYRTIRNNSRMLLDELVKDIQQRHDRRTPDAIIVRVAKFVNECIDNELSGEEVRDEYLKMVNEAPASFSMISSTATLIALAECLDTSLRKDETDERRQPTERTGGDRTGDGN